MFNILQKEGIYSMILTSGTLEPMETYKLETKIPFPVQLKNDHILESG